MFDDHALLLPNLTIISCNLKKIKIIILYNIFHCALTETCVTVHSINIFVAQCFINWFMADFIICFLFPRSDCTLTTIKCPRPACNIF